LAPALTTHGPDFDRQRILTAGIEAVERRDDLAYGRGRAPGRIGVAQLVALARGDLYTRDQGPGLRRPDPVGPGPNEGCALVVWMIVDDRCKHDRIDPDRESLPGLERAPSIADVPGSQVARVDAVAAGD